MMFTHLKVMFTVQIKVYGSGHDLSADSLACAKEYISKVVSNPEFASYLSIGTSYEVFDVNNTLSKIEARAAKRGRVFNYEEELAKIKNKNIIFNTKDEAIAAAEAALAKLLA